MKSLVFGRYMLGGSAVASMLAGCGGSQPPIGAVAQRGAIVAHAGSRILPKAKLGNLLYVADAGTDAVYVFSYPGGTLIGTLEGLVAEPHGLCTDAAGNVFVTEFGFGNNHIQEYTHGGTIPILTLNAPGEPGGCSIDPTTGDLAVAIYSYTSGSSSIAIYPAAQGDPAIYSDPDLDMLSATFDDHGNIFASGANPQGFALVELPKGSDAFTNIAISSPIFKGRYWEPIQWDTGYLTVGIPSPDDTRSYFIYRVAVSGSTGEVVGKTKLRLRHGDFYVDNAFYIQGATVAANTGIDSFSAREVAWPYPRGGTRLSGTEKFGSQYVDAVTVSAPGR